MASSVLHAQMNRKSSFRKETPIVYGFQLVEIRCKPGGSMCEDDSWSFQIYPGHYGVHKLSVLGRFSIAVESVGTEMFLMFLNIIGWEWWLLKMATWHGMRVVCGHKWEYGTEGIHKYNKWDLGYGLWNGWGFQCVVSNQNSRGRIWNLFSQYC